jgi:PIN domain nuclease of toxin-antitoxin system
MEKFVIDSCGLIAFFRREEGFVKVREKLESSTIGLTELFIHKATIIEVYYDTVKSIGIEKADDILSIIHQMSITEIETIDDEFIRKAPTSKPNIEYPLLIHSFWH